MGGAGVVLCCGPEFEEVEEGEGCDEEGEAPEERGGAGEEEEGYYCGGGEDQAEEKGTDCYAREGLGSSGEVLLLVAGEGIFRDGGRRCELAGMAYAAGVDLAQNIRSSVAVVIARTPRRLSRRVSYAVCYRSHFEIASRFR